MFGMFEPREDVALAFETRGEMVAQETLTRQLERHLARHRPVDPLGEPHIGHAAAADRLLQPVRSDLVSDCGTAFVPHQRPTQMLQRSQRGQTRQDVGRLIGRREQVPEGGRQLRTRRRDRLEPEGARRRVEVDPFLDQARKGVPRDNRNVHVDLTRMLGGIRDAG